MVEKYHNIKADEKFVLEVNEKVKTLINTITIHLEGKIDKLVEKPVAPDKSNIQNEISRSKETKQTNFLFKNLLFSG